MVTNGSKIEWEEREIDLNQQRLSEIDKVLAHAVEDQQVVGVSAMVLQQGKERYYGQAGLADREEHRPMSRDTIFRLFSLSKPVTAVAAVILLERGELDLLAPVSRFLPGFENQKVFNGTALEPVNRPVVLKDLLGMVSGIVYGGAVGFAQTQMQALFDQVEGMQAQGKELSTYELANRIGQIPLAFQPGTAWQYGLSADIMGAVIEVVTGKRFGDFLREEIFEPLGMKDTGFWVPPEKQKRLAAVYEETSQGLLRYKKPRLAILPQYDREPAFQSGGAGLVSTIEDCAKFAAMLSGNGALGATRILSPRTVRYMASNQLSAKVRETAQWDSLRGYGYGNFMRVLTEEGQAVTLGSVGEFGWDGWLGAYLCVSPKDNMALVMMMQKVGAGTTEVTRKFRSVAYASLE